MSDTSSEGSLAMWDDTPLLHDIERDGHHSPIFKKRHRGAWRLLHPARRYFGMALLALTFFLFGYIVHQPTVVQIRNRLASATGLVTPSQTTLSVPVSESANRALRVRVLNELLKERYPSGPWTSVRKQNQPALDRLASCLETNTCGPGEEKIIVLASYRFANAEKGGTSGEEVWGRSSIRAFRQLNHTILITWGHMDTLLVYQHLPDMIPAILWEGGEFKRCQMRNETNYLELEAMEVESPGGWQKGKKACMQAEDFPEGIPWWKSFMFHFWPMFQNPLGGQWVLAPEDYSWINDDVPEAHFYLGYSIEPRCLNTPTFKLREHRALILAKNDDYFSDEKNLFRHKLAGVRDRVAPLVGADGESVPFDLLSTSGEQLEPGMRRETIEEGIMTIGRQPQMQWVEILARSKVLLGIGDPLLSPSPYDALCLGVPFINPIRHWDENDPHNRTKWICQQDALKHFDPPYVYNVFSGDSDGLVDALQKAADTPIDRFIPDRMHMPNVVTRHKQFTENDWQAMAFDYVQKQYGEEADKWKHLHMDMPPVGPRGFFYNAD